MEFPLGFADAAQFAEATRRIREAADDPDAFVGVRGSAATGANAQTGAAFRPESDIDFFIVSDALYSDAQMRGARTAHGTLRVGATLLYFPVLAGLERTLSAELGRVATVRIWSRNGYDLVKQDTDIARV